MDHFLIIYRNIYIRNILNYHLKLFYYHNLFIFDNYNSFNNYKYLNYINILQLEYRDHEELELYFNRIRSLTCEGIDNYSSGYNSGICNCSCIKSIQVYGKRGSRLNNSLKIPNGIESFHFYSLYNFDFSEFEIPSSLIKLYILNRDIEYSNNNNNNNNNNNLSDNNSNCIINNNLEYNGNNLKYNISKESFLEFIQLCKNFKVLDLSKSNIKCLRITSNNFNETINVGELPASLKSIEISKFNMTEKPNLNYNLKPNVFPNGLTSLSIGIYDKVIGSGIIPNTVTTLFLGGLNQDISNIIPSNCTTLCINSSQIISKLPDSVTKLVFSRNNSSVYFLDTSFLEKSYVKVLSLAENQELIGYNRLPDSINELTISRVNQITIDQYLPNKGSLLLLQLINSPPNLILNNIHPSLVELSIISEFNNFNNLPKSLTSLWYLENNTYKSIQTSNNNNNTNNNNTYNINNSNGNSNSNSNNTTFINFQDICPSLKTLVIQSNGNSIYKLVLPNQLLALRIKGNNESTQSINNIISTSQSLEILELIDFYNIEINNHFINNFKSLSHLIIPNCKNLNINKLNSNSTINLHIILTTFNNFSIKFNSDQLNQYSNINIITHDKSIFLNLLKTKKIINK